MIGNIRILAALKIAAFAGWFLGNKPMPESEQIAKLRSALGEITLLLPANHPACRVALDALA
jgi:hypothetical protein